MLLRGFRFRRYFLSDRVLLLCLAIPSVGCLRGPGSSPCGLDHLLRTKVAWKRILSGYLELVGSGIEYPRGTVLESTIVGTGSLDLQ